MTEQSKEKDMKHVLVKAVVLAAVLVLSGCGLSIG